MTPEQAPVKRRFGSLDSLGRGAPRAVVMTPRWGGAGEAAWATRQVAGVLAMSCDVHVVTPQGEIPAHRADGLFTVHELAATDRRCEARRRVLFASIAAGLEEVGGGRSPKSPSAFYERLTDDLPDPWETAARQLRMIGPDLVVVVGCRELGAFRALEEACPQVDVLLAPLCGGMSEAELALVPTGFVRADCVVAFTEDERSRIDSHAPPSGGHGAHFVGLPMSVNQSVLREPNAFVGGREYLLVLCSGPLDEEPWRTSSELLRQTLADRRVAVSATDMFVVYDDALVLHERPPVRRGSDLLRLVAWANATVDLDPGPVFGRRSLESLLHGSPIVVPARSSARAHAQGGNGGLWFESVPEMAAEAEIMFDTAVREKLGAQGRAYATELYGSPGAFCERVEKAVEAALGPAAVAAAASS